MQENANPLDYILKCAEQGLTPKLFTVQNAKDELKKLREEVDNIRSELDKPVAWARINKHGDLYDPRLCLNPYINTQEVVPLYAYRKGHRDET
jgi:hypothetical protein